MHDLKFVVYRIWILKIKIVAFSVDEVGYCRLENANLIKFVMEQKTCRSSLASVDGIRAKYRAYDYFD